MVLAVRRAAHLELAASPLELLCNSIKVLCCPVLAMPAWPRVLCHTGFHQITDGLGPNRPQQFPGVTGHSQGSLCPANGLMINSGNMFLKLLY
jgi:hypothetical protein